MEIISQNKLLHIDEKFNELLIIDIPSQIYRSHLFYNNKYIGSFTSCKFCEKISDEISAMCRSDNASYSTSVYEVPKDE